VRHEKAEPPAAAAGGSRSRAAKRQIDSIIADPNDLGRQARARARIAAQDHHHRVCRELERLAPLRRYYGPRPLRDVPLGQFLVEGWWAA
jgi:hypothetical protein